MKQPTGLMLALGIVACSSGEPEADPCAPTSGSSAASYKLRTATCASAVQTAVNAERERNAKDPGCTGSATYAKERCAVTYEKSCPNDAVKPGGKLAINGQSTTNADGSITTSVETWVLRGPDGETLCELTYDVSVVTR